MDDYEKAIKRKERGRKATRIFWSVWAAIAVLVVVWSIGQDTYRSLREYDGTYLKWKEAYYSSAIAYYGYDTYHDKLAIMFESSDNVYVYSDVKYSLVKEFEEAESVGRFYNEYIKGQYPSEKIPNGYSYMEKSIFPIR